ncbi:MAG: hypothetical protein UV74_C0002G0050 [Candidatus Woesebacteria bacterium GW2011_GWB1_43_14]|uniref:Uncharacterized protein n=1 Tax=Candidatus Woesebacteria bacterium GW2011_GWB1_43_14 TaxID=1618578 RepID=A0A0G1FV06_9BACT|nr:MAG: hypothetical protein UV51_C0012G0010 [Candidatus Woesebacteria bacterium GW2011_GWC1_42_9]KKS98831.1 MAG: hypothetical protein UV74_C0002G0050 [Candidatus Woesebacteria bacterium GW2011_GWB1_43_14]
MLTTFVFRLCLKLGMLISVDEILEARGVSKALDVFQGIDWRILSVMRVHYFMRGLAQGAWYYDDEVRDLRNLLRDWSAGEVLLKSIFLFRKGRITKILITGELN